MPVNRYILLRYRRNKDIIADKTNLFFQKKQIPREQLTVSCVIKDFFLRELTGLIFHRLAVTT